MEFEVILPERELEEERYAVHKLQQMTTNIPGPGAPS